MVILAQCLCTSRHCILANASDQLSAETLRAELDRRIDEDIAAGIFNPFCAICKEPREKWHIETGETKWNTMDEAMPHLLASSVRQLESQEFLKRARN